MVRRTRGRTIPRNARTRHTSGCGQHSAASQSPRTASALFQRPSSPTASAWSCIFPATRGARRAGADTLSCSALRHLDLSSNALEDLPASIRSLSLLETIDLSHNRLASLLRLEGLPALRTLIASHNSVRCGSVVAPPAAGASARPVPDPRRVGTQIDNPLEPRSGNAPGPWPLGPVGESPRVPPEPISAPSLPHARTRTHTHHRNSLPHRAPPPAPPPSRRGSASDARSCKRWCWRGLACDCSVRFTSWPPSLSSSPWTCAVRLRLAQCRARVHSADSALPNRGTTLPAHPTPSLSRPHPPRGRHATGPG